VTPIETENRPVTLTELLGEGTLLLEEAERWQRAVGAHRSWPAATSFPDLGWVQPGVQPLADQLDGLSRMLGTCDGWPLGAALGLLNG
jgi:hypothetical protein